MVPPEMGDHGLKVSFGNIPVKTTCERDPEREILSKVNG